MKKLILGIAIGTIFLTACNNNSTDKSEASHTKTIDTSQVNTSINSGDIKKTVSIKEVVNSYLQIKNGLANDNGNDAASAAKAIVIAINDVDKSQFTVAQIKTYSDLADDAKEMAEHISNNAGKLEHQREHFEMLSNDIYDLVKTFGAGQKIYKDFCPMYNNKGAIWLSETKGIKNPYLGNKMPECGTVKEELK
ncbi:hypothetical protein BH09BAC2_BH09BAC2_15460 [soil metagenome]